MTYIAHVRITLRPSILDPQGQAVRQALSSLGVAGVTRVRTGKHIELSIDATDAPDAEAAALDACRKLLANPVTEDFEILSLIPVEPHISVDAA